MDILKEARELYDLGWAVHWIKPNSKAPVKSGWSQPTRDDWDTVKKDYQKGYGLGVRLGAASKLSDGYLANIDVDVKSSDPKHEVEAVAILNKNFPGLIDKAPIVRTGNGLRLFIKTKEPVKSGKLAASSEECVVRLPTTEISKRQHAAVKEGKLTDAQLKDGWRVRPAWELEFMSMGKQVVLPPSIHPETKKPYVWALSNLYKKNDLPIVEGIKAEPKVKSEATQDFEPIDVDIVGSKLPDDALNMILSGEGVDDRSSALFYVSMVMFRTGFNKQEIVSVLTDKKTFLGEAAYEHAKTNSRAVAARWLLKYTIDKAETEMDARRDFEAQVKTEVPLNDSQTRQQEKELIHDHDWRLRLRRTGKNGDGPPKENLYNVLLVMENAVSPNVIKRDSFANREFYAMDTPWLGKKGQPITDDDAIKIKMWLARKYRFEPSVNIVYEAMSFIAEQNTFHPVRLELEALPPWDYVERLDGWLKKHFHARGPDEYLAQVFRKWLVASVARTYRPGLKFDWMPILQGHQGTGKSSFGSILFGQKYFTDWLPVLSDKDAALGLQGIRCAEFGELDQLRRNELETTKAFVTRTVDKVRPPYGRKALEIHRQCVFFGTTNRDEYLKDDTGNRRFNPIEVGALDFDMLIRERDQLWAEALFIYNNDLEPSLYLQNEAQDYAIHSQAEKMVADESEFMLEAILKFIEQEKVKPEEDRFNFNKFKLMSLFNDMGPLANQPQNGRSIQYASKALKALKGKPWKSDGVKWWQLPIKQGREG